MADNRGGYRQPRNPAPVSGPGALSKRTDGGAMDGMTPPTPQTQPAQYMAGLGYGEGGNMAQQTAAPMAGNDIPVEPAPMVPLFAPTERPNEPITAGIDFGPGPGSEIMPPRPNIINSASNVMRKIAVNDPSGDSELLYRRLSDLGL